MRGDRGVGGAGEQILGLLMIHPRPMCAWIPGPGVGAFPPLPTTLVANTEVEASWRRHPGPHCDPGSQRSRSQSVELGEERGRHSGPPRAPSPSLLQEAQLRALLKELEKLRLAEGWGAWGPWAGYCLGRFWGLGSQTGWG